MIPEITLLLLLFWAIFFIFQKIKMFLITFTATLLFIFRALSLPTITDELVLWNYLLLLAISYLVLTTEKE